MIPPRDQERKQKQRGDHGVVGPNCAATQVLMQQGVRLLVLEMVRGQEGGGGSYSPIRLNQDTWVL